MRLLRCEFLVSIAPAESRAESVSPKRNRFSVVLPPFHLVEVFIEVLALNLIVRAAEIELRQKALTSGILDRARANAVRTLTAFLRSLGYDQVEVIQQGT